MHACDDCLGSVNCAGLNLQPILVKVYDLYDGGTTDKFDILFALGDDNEALIEQYDDQVSRDCWTKAALLAIAEVVGRPAPVDDEDPEAHLLTTVRTARDAFARFPWRLDALVEQAPNLYAQILEQCSDPERFERVSKRAFVKVCKTVAFDG